MENTRTFLMSLTRWHTIEQRIKEAADRLEASCTRRLSPIRVTYFAGPQMVDRIRQEADLGLRELEDLQELLDTGVMIRTAVLKKGAERGINGLLAEQKLLGMEIENLEEILQPLPPERIGLADLEAVFRHHGRGTLTRTGSRSSRPQPLTNEHLEMELLLDPSARDGEKQTLAPGTESYQWEAKVPPDGDVLLDLLSAEERAELAAELGQLRWRQAQVSEQIAQVNTTRLELALPLRVAELILLVPAGDPAGTAPS